MYHKNNGNRLKATPILLGLFIFFLTNGDGLLRRREHSRVSVLETIDDDVIEDNADYMDTPENPVDESVESTIPETRIIYLRLDDNFTQVVAAHAGLSNDLSNLFDGLDTGLLLIKTSNVKVKNSGPAKTTTVQLECTKDGSTIICQDKCTITLHFYYSRKICKLQSK